jgi:phosphoglycerate dehydrogenase-like enzyme
LSLMLALARNIPQAAQTMREGRWEKKKFQGMEIFNKTLGIIGMGRIGTVVAERALGLKMRVLGYDPFITKEVGRFPRAWNWSAWTNSWPAPTSSPSTRPRPRKPPSFWATAFTR